MPPQSPFSLEEIFTYAIDQEIKALEFYERSADQVDNVEAAALLRSLARMEAGHRRALESELRTLSQSGALREPHVSQNLTTPQDDMFSALQRVTRVLREANVELLGRQRMIEAELEVAAQVQANLLPEKVPELQGLELAVACHMARQLGGDFYDFLYNPVGQLAFTLGDVSGKGMPAALLMVAIRTLWRSRVRDGHSPAKVLTLLTQDVAAELGEGDHFVTMISATWDPGRSTFAFANAGHWAPLYLSYKNEFGNLPPTAMPVGLDPDTKYEGHEIILSPGDVVVIFSDGIVEARDEHREEFGEERLRAIVEAEKESGAENIRTRIMEEVDAFAGGRRDDDQTLVVVCRVENGLDVY